MDRSRRETLGVFVLEEVSGVKVARNHSRRIGAFLSVLEEDIRELREMVGYSSKADAGQLVCFMNDLQPCERDRIRRVMDEILEVLGEARDELGLRSEARLLSRELRGKTSFWFYKLYEIAPRRLRPYGDVSPELSDYIDRLIGKLQSLLDRIHRIAEGGGPVAGEVGRGF